MDRKESFWMSMIEKYEKRNYDLDERQCNLQHRLQKLKCKLSSSNQNVAVDTSSSCSCSYNTTSSTTRNSSASNKESRCSVPSSTKICLYKPKTSDKFIDYCGDRSNDSMELQYIAKLHDLVNREKQMKMQVKDMEVREKAFIHTLKRADQMYTALENKCKKHLLEEEKLKNAKFQKMTRELLDENACLCDQLQDTKLELKHCIEKLQGPIARQMDQERRKSKTLQDELKMASKAMQNKDSCYSKDLCTLQKKLAETTKNLASINALNDTLQKQMCSLSCKYKELQKDLINHKINEARTLERANEIIAEQAANRPPASSKKTQFSHRRKVDHDPDSLFAIARKLSKTIANVERCDCCSTTASQNLTDTMRGIVLVADMMDKVIKPDADSSDSDDKKPSPPSSGSYTCRPCTGSNLVNEQPVRDVNLEKPTKLCMGDTNTGGPVDDDTYAPIESLASGSSLRDIPLPMICACQQMQAEMHLIEDKEVVKDVAPIRPEAGDVQVLTQVETTGDLKISVETDVEVCDKISDDIHITTAFTKSGVLEVVTEGPAGIIETTMTLTPCGSVEVITKVVDYPDDLKQADVSSIVPDLTAIKEKISAAAAEDVLIVSQIRSEDSTVKEAASFSETLSVMASEELAEVKKLPPAEPASKREKPKGLVKDFEMNYEQIGDGELEDYNVQIEITNSPFLNELGLKHCAKELPKKVKTLEKSRVSVTSYYVAKALENVDQDVEYALGSGDKSSGEVLQELEEASLVLSETDADPTLRSFRFKYSSDAGPASVSTKSTPLRLRTEDLQSACAEAEEPVGASFSDVKIEDGHVVESVHDIDNDRKFVSLKNVQIKKKFLLGERVQAVSRTIMATPDECDCDGCLCDECSPKCMSSRNLRKDQHPPDCDCVDCLCKPCASFPADYKTRVHPPGCDCIDCLCMQPPCFGEVTPKAVSSADPVQAVRLREERTTPVYDDVERPRAPDVEQPSAPYVEQEPDVEREPDVKPPSAPLEYYEDNILVKKESHMSTCTCLDCLLTCGVREKPKGICKGCKKPCASSGGAMSGCDRKAFSERDSVCSCVACKSSFCYDEPFFEDAPLKVDVPNNSCEKQPITEPTCCTGCSASEDILRKKHEKELQDLRACLDKIKCSCAEAEDAACAPSRCSAGLMAFRNVIENLQTKCKEKDKVICGMIKDMKNKMGNNHFCNLLGITSGNQERGSGSNIYCCACDDDRSVMEEFHSNPCKCNPQEDEDDSSSCSSCSACCTEFEDVNSQNTDASSEDTPQNSYHNTNRKRAVKRQGSSCSCLVDEEAHQGKSCVSSIKGKRSRTQPEQPSKEFKSASLGACPGCYPGSDEKKSRRKQSGHKMETSQAEPQRMVVCMTPDLLRKQVKSAPVSITEMRKIGDGILIKWSKARSKNVLGYEVVINGQIKTKVRSSDRTSAMIYNLAIKKPITIAVYAITSEGRLQPAAKAVFDV